MDTIEVTFFDSDDAPLGSYECAASSLAWALDRGLELLGREHDPERIARVTIERV